MSEFLAQLNVNDLVLTPNQRLTNTLHLSLQTYHLSQGNRAYAPPTLICFPQLMRLLWKSYFFLAPKRLLSSDEEAWLWRKIIIESEISHDLLNAQQTAALAQTAWHHLKHWRLTVELLKLEHHNENTHLFKQWASHFLHLCQQRKIIDESSALEVCCKDKSFLSTLPFEKIYFYHFLELTPLQENFKSSLEKSKKTIIVLQPSLHNQNTARLELSTFDEEILCMTQWAYQQYKDNPNKKIACVVPNLQQQREAILRNFKTIFNTEVPPIDISAGYKLVDFTMIQHTLLIINLLETSFDYEAFSTYLRSVYFQANEDDICTMHLLDAELRKRCKKTISLSQLIALLPTVTTTLDKENIEEKLLLLNGFMPQQQTLPVHCEAWLNLLCQLGWPGQRNLHSTEYQVTKRFVNLLHEIENYNFLQEKWSWQEFTALLKIKCQTAIFQPESEKTSIQILGLLEASGMTFDAMWIVNLDDKTWPTASSPNPLLPYALQKKKLMPNASPEREYIYCKEVLQQLINSSKQVIVSSAKYDEDKQLHPSPLISKIQKKIEVPRIDSSENNAQRVIIFEKITDTYAPPVSSEEKISGGTSVVQYQAQCPFKAFADLRLQAKTIKKPLDTPDALIRGSTIHHVLELLWKKLKTSEKLLALTEKELEDNIQQAITSACPRQEKTENFLHTLEKMRLQKVVRAWLDVEKKRPNFRVIAIEDKREYRYKNITLRLRIDRIDQENDGQTILIDYKTGNSPIYHWFGKRLKEPQLPIYCISNAGRDIGALCFAQLRWNDFCFKGIAEGNTENNFLIPFENLSAELREATWPAQMTTWKNNINHLLDEFLQGHAAVDPLDTTTCAHCHLTSLCRIFEHA